MKIVGIVGIPDLGLRGDRLWTHVREAFAKVMPGVPLVLEREFYLPWQRARIRAFADDIVAKHDTGEELILVGYNLGGIIACAIAPRFAKSRIRLIATVGAPHRIRSFYRMLGASNPAPDAKVVTFAGIFDPVVLWFLTSIPGSAHVNLLSDHLLWFLFSRKPAEKVARGTRLAIEGKTRDF